MMTSLLILGGREAQLPCIRQAQESGLFVVVIDPDNDCVGRHQADCFYARDLSDAAFCISVARRHNVCGALTLAADYPVPCLAQVCKDLELPGLDPLAATRATNKREMALQLAAAGIPVPGSRIVTSRSQWKSLSEEFGVFVVKPALSSGSRGVSLVTPELARNEAQTRIQTALSLSQDGAAIAQEYVTGPEVSVEAITCRGTTSVVAVVDKLLSDPPWFVELGHNIPTTHAAASVWTLHQIAEQATQALGIDNAASHTEIRLTDSGPKVIEVAARLGGGFINSDLVPLATGVNMIQAVIDVAMGRHPDLEVRHSRSAAIRFFHSPLMPASAVDSAVSTSDMPCVERVVIDIPANVDLETCHDSRGRHGYVLCSAATRDQAVYAVESAVARISQSGIPVEATCL